jgi:hypothetical protein
MVLCFSQERKSKSRLLFLFLRDPSSGSVSFLFYVHTLFCPEMVLKGGARILIEITSIKKAA